MERLRVISKKGLALRATFREVVETHYESVPGLWPANGLTHKYAAYAVVCVYSYRRRLHNVPRG